MKRILYCFLALSLLLTGCDNTQFKDILRVDLKGAEIYSEDEPFPLYVESGWLVFSRRKSDGYGSLSLTIPNLCGIVLGPEHGYYQDGTHYLFRNGNEYVELECADFPFIRASFSSGSRLEYTPDRKSAGRINEVLSRCIYFPPDAFPTDEVAVPVEAEETYEEYWAEADTVGVDDVEVNDVSEWFPSHPTEVEEGLSYADASYGRLLLEGDFVETGQYHRGIGMFGASFSAPPSAYHIAMYEKVLVRTFPDGSSGQYNYDSQMSETGYRAYQDAGGSKRWIGYNPSNGSFFVEMESGGYRWNCDIVPADSYSNTSPNQQNNLPQTFSPENSGKEMMYRNQYETWERTVQRNWEMLTTRREGASSVTIRMNFRNAQSQMRQIRQNAQMEGIRINMSPWENASVPYSLYDD